MRISPTVTEFQSFSEDFGLNIFPVLFNELFCVTVGLSYYYEFFYITVASAYYIS
jgi:hypothetical protein